MFEVDGRGERIGVESSSTDMHLLLFKTTSSYHLLLSLTHRLNMLARKDQRKDREQAFGHRKTRFQGLGKGIDIYTLKHWRVVQTCCIFFNLVKVRNNNISLMEVTKKKREKSF